jgi:hypothetical protein
VNDDTTNSAPLAQPPSGPPMRSGPSFLQTHFPTTRFVRDSLTLLALLSSLAFGVAIIAGDPAGDIVGSVALIVAIGFAIYWTVTSTPVLYSAIKAHPKCEPSMRPRIGYPWRVSASLVAVLVSLFAAFGNEYVTLVWVLLVPMLFTGQLINTVGMHYLLDPNGIRARAELLAAALCFAILSSLFFPLVFSSLFVGDWLVSLSESSSTFVLILAAPYFASRAMVGYVTLRIEKRLREA